ncbi:hypothetical protein XAXN_11215 [Xanthomonas axonopodis]|uniref:Uncharacterized protein n=1 Tax=Xanthomonas axonopodis TaxID=53413 RepID=A0A0P6VAR7_9XANT|nr:hypothetical protein XAXN_11215 [Xanthomonas axonopodis]
MRELVIGLMLFCGGLFAELEAVTALLRDCDVLHHAVRNARRVQLAGLICRRDRRTLPQRVAKQETFR